MSYRDRPDPPPPAELTPAHAAALERLVARDFSLVAFPLYASAIGVRRGDFAALLTPVQNGALRLLGDPCYLIDGNFAVRIQRQDRTYFVWKSREVLATPELLGEFARFVVDLAQTLLTET